MQFDDRLATVLRSDIASEQAARTQYLQLLDLLGTAPPDAQSPTIDAAYRQLDTLDEAIPARDRANIVRLSGRRLRDPRLVYRLSTCEPAVVSAAMSSARLSDSDWLDLIPQLPISARGFLRHGDHSTAVNELLGRLGIGDMVLPDNSVAFEQPDLAGELLLEDELLDAGVETAPSAPVGTKSPNSEIGEIVRKIEAYRKAKGDTPRKPRQDANDPRLPLGDRDLAGTVRETRAFDFSTDANGRVIWADPAIAPMVFGMIFLDRRAMAPARPDPETIEKLRRQQPVRGGTIELTAAPAISGTWQIDATPHFSKLTGAYAGYLGRLRRIAPLTAAQEGSVDEPADRMRQLLHELRTPVNAIQGFAEVIQQQLFGPAPHEYRALAANIASDAARMLAGFEEIDRLARLDSDALPLPEGSANLLALTQRSLKQVEPVLAGRDAGFTFSKGRGPFEVAYDSDELERTVWRIVASLSAAIAPGEICECSLRNSKGSARLAWELPVALQDHDDLFKAAIHDGSQALLASSFGSGFALRLARAEARAGGGSLEREGDRLVLQLPL